MKLYDSVGPNPHVVRMVLAEKGIAYETQRVDLRGGENRRAAYLEVNPVGQLPTLELEDGTRLSEITAISEYLDEVVPEPPLLGTTPVARGQARMWVRRLDLNIIEPMANGYRFTDGLPLFKDRIPCIPEAGPALKQTARHWLGWLDGQIAGRDYIAGSAFTLADVMLYCFTVFGGKVGQPLDPAWGNLAAWFERVDARPSAKA